MILLSSACRRRAQELNNHKKGESVGGTGKGSAGGDMKDLYEVKGTAKY